MNAIESWVLGYVVNAVWQGAVLCAAAWLLAKWTRRLGPLVEHRIWCVALVAQVVLPAMTVRPVSLLWGANGATSGLVTVVTGDGVAAGAVRMPSLLLVVAALLFVATVLALTVRLAWQVGRTYELRCSSKADVLQGIAGEVWRRACDRFKVCDADVCVSDAVNGPVTVGMWRQVVILPAGFVAQVSGSELEAAIAHECAHMQRHDFAKNLLYETLLLPIAWHPAAWFTRAQVAESREMVCDAMAAEAMAGRQMYARALLQLASAMVERAPRPNLHAIGVFDANRLEERVMRLTERRLEVQGARRFAMVALCVAVGVGTVATAAELRVSVAVPATVSLAGPHVAALAAQSGAVDGTSARKVSAGTMAGNIHSKVTPVYPQEAKDGKISGSVVMHAIIGKDGAISQLDVISGPAELRQSALEAVKQWVYKPYLLNGQPTEVETTITVNYSLAKQ
jgi:TonB family protein